MQMLFSCDCKLLLLHFAFRSTTENRLENGVLRPFYTQNQWANVRHLPNSGSYDDPRPRSVIHTIQSVGRYLSRATFMYKLNIYLNNEYINAYDYIRKYVFVW